MPQPSTLHYPGCLPLGMSYVSRPPYLDFDDFTFFDVGDCQRKNCRLGCCSVASASDVASDDDAYNPEDGFEPEPEKCSVIVNSNIPKAARQAISTAITQMVDDYLNNDEQRWTTCLLNKWSLSDCVTGCHNGEIEDKVLKSPQDKLFNFHPHIRYFFACTVLDMVHRMDYAWFNRHYRDFEDLFDWVERMAGHASNGYQLPFIYGFGRVAIYDTALRIGFHLKRNPRNIFNDCVDKNGYKHIDYKNRVLPKKYVYLHAGAMKGARALARLGLISKKKNSKGGITLDLKEFVKYFPKIIRRLEPYQIEDFLCVKHRQLEALANRYCPSKAPKTPPAPAPAAPPSPAPSPMAPPASVGASAAPSAYAPAGSSAQASSSASGNNASQSNNQTSKQTP